MLQKMKILKFRKIFEKKLKLFFGGFGNITPWLGLNFFAGLRSRRFRRDMSILSCHFHHFAWLISRLYRRTARFFPSGFSRSARELAVGEERIQNFWILGENGPTENRVIRSRRYEHKIWFCDFSQWAGIAEKRMRVKEEGKSAFFEELGQVSVHVPNFSWRLLLHSFYKRKE